MDFLLNHSLNYLFKMKKPKHIIHDNTVYELSESELFSNYKKLSVPVKKPDPEWLGPKIPWDMWCELVAWCQVTQEKFKSEALAFLFFDIEKKKWSHWYPPQITQGMTVQADDDSEEYRLQRKHFPDLQFGSLHHHCTAKAFASGTDQSDEIDRDGFHFTIGNLESKEHGVHFRLCLEGTCYEMNPASVIEPSPEVSQLPEKYSKMVHSKMIQEPQDISLWDFTEPLKNITKKNYNTYQPYKGGSGQTKIGGRTNKIPGSTTWVNNQLIPNKDNPSKVFKQLLDDDIEQICNILQDKLWAYGFTTGRKYHKPFSRYMAVFQTDYKSLVKNEEKKEMVNDTVLSVLEFLDFDTEIAATKKEIKWVNHLLRLIQTELNDE